MTIRTAFSDRGTSSPPCHDRLAGLKLSLRAAADADVPFLQRLFASFRAEEMALVTWPPSQKTAFLNDQFRLQHHHFVSYFPAADFWIVERSDRPGETSPVGRFYFDCSTAPWRIIDIGFLPEARGQGFGTALLQWARELAVGAGATGIDLHVVVVNARAAKLYRCLGFLPEGETEGYHQRMVWRPGA